jgi:hypothetical protein
MKDNVKKLIKNG